MATLSPVKDEFEGFDLSDLTPAEEILVLALCRRDLKWYIRYVHPEIPLEWFHRVWCDELQNEDNRRVLLIAPPGFYKSTILRCYIEWWMGNHPEESAALVMNTASQAEAQLMAMENVIEGTALEGRYKKVFPGVEPDRKSGWSKTMAYLKRSNMDFPDPSIIALGTMGPIQGKHPKIGVVDDPTDQDEAMSEAVMEGQRNWFKGVFLDRMGPTGKVVSIMTRWSGIDLSQMILDGEMEPPFRVLVFPAVVSEELEAEFGEEYGIKQGDPLWPERYDHQVLAGIKKTKGTPLYKLTYLCDTKGFQGTLFLEQYFLREGFYQEVPWDEVIFTAAGMDLASSDKERNAYTSYVAIAMTADRRYFVYYWARDHLTHGHKEWLKAHWMASGRPHIVRIEAVQFQSAFVQEVISGTSIVAAPVTPEKDKFTRKLPVAQMYENGQIHHIPRLRDDDFEAELRAFPLGATKDLVDGLEMAIDPTGAAAALGMGDSAVVREVSRWDDRVMEGILMSGNTEEMIDSWASRESGASRWRVN